MFTQTKINENYLPEHNMLGLVDNLYTDFIEPVLDGILTGDFLAKWENTPLNFQSGTLERCSYNTYKAIKEKKSKYTPEDDSNVFQFDDFNSIESIDRNTKSTISVRDTLLQVVNVLNVVNDSTTLSLSNRPLHYKKYKGHDGFMGWHTNSDNPGDRWYLVYNTNEDSSFFRYIDPKTEEMVTKWEPKGWSLNHFVLGDFSKPLWHCCYTKNNRFSFGVRDVGPILNKHKWKDVTVGHSTVKNKEEDVRMDGYIKTLIAGCRIAQDKGVYTLEEARSIMNSIEWLAKAKDRGLFY